MVTNIGNKIITPSGRHIIFASGPRILTFNCTMLHFFCKVQKDYPLPQKYVDKTENMALTHLGG